MKKEYNEAYKNLFLEYPVEYPNEFLWRRIISKELYDSTRMLRIIRNHINDFETELSEGQILRSDAKHFLLINIHHMILNPILVAEYEEEPVLIGEELPNVLEDVDMILNYALSNSENIVTGHTILNTIDSLWSELNTTRLNLWGDDERLE